MFENLKTLQIAIKDLPKLALDHNLLKHPKYKAVKQVSPQDEQIKIHDMSET